jgi:hypothetical protein
MSIHLITALLAGIIFISPKMTLHPDKETSNNYLDKIAIVDLIIHKYSEAYRSEKKSKASLKIGLHNRFSNLDRFTPVRCKDLNWGPLYCDLVDVVRFYDKIRFLNTKWFDYEEKASLHLIEEPNFDKIHIYFHFSPVAIDHYGTKAVVMVKVQHGESDGMGMIFSFEKKDEWEILDSFEAFRL